MVRILKKHGIGLQYECPAGRYGQVEGLTSKDCSGLCQEGYYCHAGSTSRTQYECGGADVYCPVGSQFPTPVAPGYFTVGPHSGFDPAQSNLDVTTRTGQEICPPGHYCIDGVVYICDSGLYGDEFGLNTSECNGPCHAGYFCPAQSVSPTQYPCGSARFYCPQGSAEPTRKYARDS